jgi:tetratricopeptide (TPR) repeat protein
VVEKSALAKNYTENADALQLYQRGRVEWSKRSWQGMIDAEQLFRRAVEKDPNFALAYVGLADTQVFSSINEAESAVQKALELDPNLAEAHATLGFIQMFLRWSWREAEGEFNRSLELNPNYATAHHWYAQLLAVQGRNAEAKAAMRRALDINPQSHNFLADLGQIYYFNREYREAEEYCRQALAIYPDFVFAHEYLADIYSQTGEYEKAFEEEISAQKTNSAFANESAKRREELEANIAKQRTIYREGGHRKFVENLIGGPPEGAYHYLNAARYAFLGEKEKALNLLEKAIDGKEFLSAFVKADPVFDSLRGEPRYQEILHRMNLAY